MRKCLAILLLLVHLFNFAGYALLFEIFIGKAETRQVKLIDAGEYNEDALLELRVPIQLPYLNDWNDYERVDGEIEIDGVHYSYVKRKISKDTLYLVCLPNQTKTSLKKARQDISKTLNGHNAADEKNTNNIKKPAFGAEYYDCADLFSFSPGVRTLNNNLPPFCDKTLSSFIPTPFRPPGTGCYI